MISGPLVNLVNVSQNMGILLVYSCGWCLHWRMLCWAMLVINIIAFIAIFFLPETPVYLLSRNKGLNAMKVLIVLDPRNETKKQDIFEGLPEKPKPILESLKNQSFWKPLVTVVTLQLLALTSGCMTLISYMVNVFEATGTSVNPYESSVITMLVKTIVSFVAYIPVKYFSRRTLFLSSGLIMSLCCTVLSCYPKLIMLLNVYVADVSNIIPMACLGVYNIAYAVGLEPVFRLLSSEYFPGQVRSLASGISLILISALLALLGQALPYALDNIGVHGTFAFFAAGAFISCIYCYLFLPEAHGKTLSEMEQHFQESKWFSIQACNFAVTFTPSETKLVSLSSFVEQYSVKHYSQLN